MRRLALTLFLVALLPMTLAAAPCCNEQESQNCCVPGGECPTLPNGACVLTAPRALAPSAPSIEPRMALVSMSTLFLCTSPHVALATMPDPSQAPQPVPAISLRI